MSRSLTILALLAGLLAGCAASPGSAPADAASLGERGPGVGLEVAWWVVEDPFVATADPTVTRLASGPTVRDVLLPYEGRPVPVTAAAAALWRANGLRLVSVPRADLAALRRSLRLVGPVQQQWLGETPRWVEAVRGPKWGGSALLALDNGPLRLDAGRLRLLVRSWSAPGPGGPDAGVLQVEIVPQHVLPFAPLPDLAAALEPPKPRPSRDAEGVAFERLLLETAFDGVDALVIVPESPASATPASEGFETAGPDAPMPPTLGEVMLTDTLSGGRRGTRVMVVLIPHAPRTFSLFPG